MTTENTTSLPVTQGDVMSTQLLGEVTTNATPAASLPLFATVERSGVSVPDSVLHREYPVATYQWVPGAPFNTLLGTLPFPECLFDSSFIRSKVSGFRYFTCSGVSVRVQIAGNPMSYGALMVSFDPATGYDATSSSATDVVTSSGYPHMLVSATSTDAHEFVIPYICPDARIDLARYRPDGVGTVDISVVAPLTYAMAPALTPAIVTIYAKFVDPRVDVPSSCTMQPPAAYAGKFSSSVSW